jgi:hypothetical protein
MCAVPSGLFMLNACKTIHTTLKNDRKCKRYQRKKKKKHYQYFTNHSLLKWIKDSEETVANKFKDEAQV